MSGRALRACPLCGEDATRELGLIRHAHPTLIAGVEADLGDETFRLMGCDTCGFRFKEPAPPAEVLLDCYARAPADQWSIAPDPYERRFDLVKDVVQRFAPDPASALGRVLDIGCFNGALLNFLGGPWEAFGLEPSAKAADLARMRGVTILGPVLGEAVPSDLFDAALAIDVVEHVPDPMVFFRHVARVLRPGGVAVVLTGDTAAPAWRWQGSRYWYCSLPEHVSFFRRSALEYVGRACGLKIVYHRRLSHIRAGLGRRLREAAKNVAYGVAVRVGWLPSSALRRHVLARRAPGWLSANDHQLVVMRREMDVGLRSALDQP